MILELDVGNSWIKWRVLDDKRGVIVTGRAASLAELEGQLSGSAASFVDCRVCAVQSALSNAEHYAGVLRQYVSGRLVFAASGEHLAGVQNSYAEPARLGVDRWLAMAAGYSRVRGACMIIDAGTAITVDYVRDDGLHLGGLIAPGYQQMKKTLVGSAGLVVSDEFLAGPQTCTANCVAAGVETMLSGFMKQVHVAGLVRLGQRARFLVSGGAALLVHRPIESCEVMDDLVFAGLALACPFE